MIERDSNPLMHDVIAAINTFSLDELKNVAKYVQGKICKSSYELTSEQINEIKKKVYIGFYDKIKGTKYTIDPTKIGKYSNFINIMRDDWSFLFQGLDETKIYYVYAHVNPQGKFYKEYSNRNGFCVLKNPIYIGKGKDSRAFNINRTNFHNHKLRKLAEKYTIEDVTFIMKDKLKEGEALELESKLIYYYGCRGGSYKPLNGENTGCLYNNKYEKSPRYFYNKLRRAD